MLKVLAECAELVNGSFEDTANLGIAPNSSKAVFNGGEP